MIGLVVIAIACMIAPVVWLALEACRAPLASEGPDGLCVLAPGCRWVGSLPGFDERVDPLTLWGLY